MHRKGKHTVHATEHEVILANGRLYHLNIILIPRVNLGEEYWKLQKIPNGRIQDAIDSYI